MSQAVFKVAGMTCDQCADSVKGALRNIGAEGHVDLSAQMVTVQYDEQKLTTSKIQDAIEEQGYKVV
ncbi:cation transporter [Paenibacillus sp. GD4]|uniref:heavy-metal-associated domain-containing protein n=1 Tax=Paenibacillus sp. GD4 TaxID=3068890 RepID=UPI002796C0EB|nr:cation transporter [Paenibacillus sp. GD4]MDQ1913545.1 cation transporter [Paenibacillus sp. GD4]